MINHKSSIPIKSGSIISRKSQSAFTLIELLVVIVIIGVLATVILVSNFTGVNQRARDSRRKSDLRQIQTALELIRSDTGSYPTQLYSTNCPTSSSLVVGAETYMQKIPCDPSSLIFYSGGNPGNYYYNLTGTTYNLSACIENPNDTDPNIGTNDLLCDDTGGRYYVLLGQ